MLDEDTITDISHPDPMGHTQPLPQEVLLVVERHLSPCTHQHPHVVIVQKPRETTFHLREEGEHTILEIERAELHPQEISWEFDHDILWLRIAHELHEFLLSRSIHGVHILSATDTIRLQLSGTPS